MPTDPPRALGLTHDERRRLRRIRRLQLVEVCADVCTSAGFLVFVVAELFELRMMALAGKAYLFSDWDLVTWIGFAMTLLGMSVLSTIGNLLKHSLCPRCGHEFFILDATVGQKFKHPARAPVRRRAGVRSQQCANCGLSLGLLALPAEPMNEGVIPLAPGSSDARE